MDRSAVPRSRQQGAQPTSRPPARITRDKKAPYNGPLRRPYSGRIRSAKDSSEIIRVPRRRAEAIERSSADSDSNAKNFTVANVGRNGTLYLKPSRMPPPHIPQAPVTPPDTADGAASSLRGRPDETRSFISGTWTPRHPLARAHTDRPPVPVPPPSMANVQQRRRTRSHSFSTLRASSISSQSFDPNDFQILLNGKDTARPKSSVDLDSGLLDFRIPNYKLGTPRFSDRGTAYLHNSMYTTTTLDRASAISKADYDSLFPAPPGRSSSQDLLARASSASPYLHPSQAAYSQSPSRTPPTPISPSAHDGSIDPSIFDGVQAHIDDATIVRYSPITGRITAATPVRLIAQISSPLFLDYELLADFFLTYRNFLSSRELLEHLLARMKWALANDCDAGRIVRVRTFVALRHWILNYFADDFEPDLSLRQRFCNRVNELAWKLRQRYGPGGPDINIIGELKKCWRRTCAKFWPVSDALDTSPDVDILPGRDQTEATFGASSTSLSQSPQRRPSHLDFRRGSSIEIPANFPDDLGLKPTQTSGTDAPPLTLRKTSIPTSPMDHDSLAVLCGCLPFLTLMMAAKNRKAPTAVLQQTLPLPEIAGSVHKRSGSFTDALRDRRQTLPSAQADAADLQSSHSMTFTGGLVRGLLLQPSPSKVELLVPISPNFETREPHLGGDDISYFQTNVGVKRIVGDFRRALSSRKGRFDSPASSHRSVNSLGSRNSARLPRIEQPSHGSAWQQLRGPPRIDMLAEIIEYSYKEVFEETPQVAKLGTDVEDFATNHVEHIFRPDERARPLARDPKRLDSHITTGSRSIVIFDDTGIPEMPVIPGALPSVSSWASGMAPNPLFRNDYDPFAKREVERASPTYVDRDAHYPASINAQIHDSVALPGEWQDEAPDDDDVSEHTQARKSSSIHASTLDLLPAQPQLRRRPGGDLKTADHVHDLEPTPKRETTDSYSTFTRSLISSGELSDELSGTHFSGQEMKRFQITNSFADWNRGSISLLPTHSSQPNMRPSFEKQVSHLTQLSDRVDNGGIQDALARLEGKQPTLRTSNSAVASDHVGQGRSIMKERTRPSSFSVVYVSDLGYAEGDTPILSPRTDRQGASIYRLSDSDTGFPHVPASEVHKVQKSERPVSDVSEELPLQSPDYADTPSKLIKTNEVTSSTKALDHPDSPRKPPSVLSSFLLDDDESLSDISTEIAEQSDDEDLGFRSFWFDDTVEDEVSRVASFQAPPTPPSTIDPAESLSPVPSPDLPHAVVDSKKHLKAAASAPKLLPSGRRDEDILQRPAVLKRFHTSPPQQSIAHLPFVLAFGSDVIAEQLTIIEKDALDEVEWKDLVALNWSQSPKHFRNWVDFLKTEPNGVDIVIARFNLVVKWVVSECLLTEASGERARCIVKFIHVAAHCHRLRNYASMYQITLALRSADLARLHQTWALVAPAEKTMLDRLEKLCQPVRNFHNLRSEMESAPTETGCIPFIGLYTHDLMYNAQKPGLIAPLPPGKEQLVNFERHQTSAKIVKGLLRLIEASSKYEFRPHPEVLSRCLWLAALEDADISARSKTVEQ